MYLKKLKIQGFKSFPEKTELDFNKGITAVVGPNGSGKSNISDAVRWALGEQSAKSLRGGKMEDIIFAGTQNRKALGFAEVTLVLDNEDKKIPLLGSEISVTRRVYRSGEGEYFLNKTACRLKDIHKFFMDTGVGKEGYSIIGQGKIDEILSTKSEDRRLLFEEAAGIVKYKTKKMEAESKLEKERQNLLRVKDIISEIEGQLEPLLNQSETAKRYVSIMERLKHLRANIFIQEVSETEEKINTLNQRVEIAQDNLTNQVVHVDDLKEEISQLKTQLDDLNKDQEDYRACEQLKNSELEGKSHDINMNRERITHLDSDIARLEGEINEVRLLIDKKTGDRQFALNKLQLLNTERNDKERLLHEKQDEFDVLSEALNEAEQKILDYNNSILNTTELISDKKYVIEKKKLLYGQMEEKKEIITEDFDRNESLLHDIGVKSELLNKKIETIDKEKSYETNRLSFFEEEITTLKREEAEYREGFDALAKRYSNLRTRYKLLKELAENYEGYYKSVKSILSAKKANPSEFSGIIDTVGSLLTVKPEYETAMEIALGGYIQNIVTETEEASKSAIDYLKRTKQGRATFLPLSAIKHKDLGNVKERLLTEQGVIGIAQDLADYEAKYANVFSNLLGRVIIMDNIDNALKLFKKYNHSYKIVTLGGELFNPGGAITGGSKSGNTVNLFGRSREITFLAEEIESIKTKLEQESAKGELFDNKLTGSKSKATRCKAELQRLSIDEASIKQEKLQVDERTHKIEGRLKGLTEESVAAEEELIRINREIRNEDRLLRDLEKELGSIKESFSEFQGDISGSKEEKEDRIKVLTGLKIEINSINEKHRNMEENAERILGEINENQKKSETIRIEMKSLGEARVTWENQILSLSKEIEVLKDELSAQRCEIQDIIKQTVLVKARLEQKESELMEALAQISTLENEVTKVALRKEQTEEDIRRLYDLMWDEYEITYSKAKEFADLGIGLSQMHSEEKDIKNEIKSLGSVNVGAIYEYKEKKERYDFLTNQCGDIEKSEEGLMLLIQELTESMEVLFRDQITVISHNFNIVFNEMFSGGTARLELSDEDHILSSGIEIVVQPPGKKLQIMTLLSGGERALTAMALLFAILKMKPSPFCILDEIEAALDDANVTRFADYLKNFSHDTQFILITHKKGTMTAADALYGVTMQEQGVSKLISVSFEEAKAM